MGERGVGGQRALRLANEERVMAALRLQAPASQAEISRISGLSPASVTDITRHLGARGRLLAVPGEDRRETRFQIAPPVGRALTIELSYESAQITGFDFDAERRQHADTRLKHVNVATDLRDLRELGTRVLERLGASDWPEQLVVGVRTAIDSARGEMSPSVRFRGWPLEPIAEVLGDALGSEVIVENDANLRALAEHAWGGGRGADDFLYVKTSPGVGAGLIMNGKIYHGSNGMAGEVGHVVVNPTGPLCECGNRGCLHALASARMLLRQAKVVDESVSSIHDILRRVRERDRPFIRLLSEAGTNTGLAIASVVSILGLTRVVVGGLLSEAGADYMDPLRQAVDTHTLRRVGSPLEIVPGMPDSDLSQIGALRVALDRSGSWLPELPAWIRENRPK